MAKENIGEMSKVLRRNGEMISATRGETICAMREAGTGVEAEIGKGA